MRTQPLVLIILTCILSLLFSTCVYADLPTYNKVVFFGDSLSDQGLVYMMDNKVMPVDPPYYQGRFSNDKVWTDYVADNMLQSHITSQNYAMGGETALNHNGDPQYYPINFQTSLDMYNAAIAISKDKDRSHTLYVIWIGSNDYLYGAPRDDSGNPKIDEYTTQVVQGIQTAIEGLIAAGGKSFVVITLPDFSLTPQGQASGIAGELSDLANAHNVKLMTMVSGLQAKHSDININVLDVSNFFRSIIQYPAIYNLKYNLNITDTTTPCWNGGFTAQQTQFSEETILHQLQKQLGRAPQKIKLNELAHAIAMSPDLSEAFRIGQYHAQGETQCANPDEHIFWDKLHPTGVMHKVIYQFMMDNINRLYQKTA